MKKDCCDLMPAPITLEEFTDIADRTYRPEQPSSAWELRHALLSLAQNSDAIWRLIRSSVQTRLTQNLPAEQATYFTLHQRATYSIRATVWLPENTSQLGTFENAIFAYDYPHNHNFDLLTVTVFGPGYETDLYSVSEIDSAARVGDLVPANFLGRHRLSPGTMLFYEAFQDVHSQIPVDEISVALNLMPRTPLYRGRPQHAFEIDNPNVLRVSGALLSEELRELWAIRMLAKLHHSGFGVLDSLHAARDARSTCPVGDLADQMIALKDDPDLFGALMMKELTGGSSANYRRTARTVRGRRVVAGPGLSSSA